MKVRLAAQVAARQVRLALKRARYLKVIGLRQRLVPGLAVFVPRGRLVIRPPRLLGLRGRCRS